MKQCISIIGAGGLAVTAAWKLARDLGEQYKIKIYDQDRIELSNLNRQILFSTADLKKNKAEVLAKRLSKKFSLKSISARPYFIDQNNIESELADCCAIIDATDSARTSFLINDYSVKNLKIFSYAGVVGRYGQALLVNPALGSPCLRCIFGNWEEKDYLEIESTCQAAGVIGPVAGYLGLIQAQQLISTLKLEQEQTRLVKVSLFDMQQQKIAVSTSKTCINNCNQMHVVEVNLTEKECPQTFILSKLALERAEQNTKLIFSFKTKENALKTMNSLITEGKIVNWLGNDEQKYKLLSCN